MSSLTSTLKAVAPLVLALIAMMGSTTVRAQDSENSDISITKGDAVHITGVDDWLIGVFGPNDSVAGLTYRWYPSCVYSSTGSFTIEIVSGNGGSRLHLESGPNSMNYDLFMYMRRNNGGFRIWPQSQIPGYTTPTIFVDNVRGSTSPTCADTAGRNIWFAALVEPSSFNPAPPGIYQDLATIIVTPE